MAMAAMVATDTARGPLMPMPTMALAAMAATAMAAMVATDTARGLLMPKPTMAPVTAMAAMALTAVDTATAMASKFVQVCNNILIPNCHSKHLKTSSYIGGQEH